MHNIFKQKKTYVYLIIGILLLVISIIVGISDNPPGIIISYIGFVFLVIAFTYNYQKTKSYVILLISSIIGFVLFAILHNVLEAIGKGTFLETIGVFFFLAGIFLCPAGILVGIFGIITGLIKRKKYSALDGSHVTFLDCSW